MKRMKCSLTFLIIALAVFLTLSAGLPGAAQATTANPSAGSTGYELWQFTVPTVSATSTPIKFKVPWPYRVVYLGANVYSMSGTGPLTATIDVKQGTTSLLSAPIDIASNATNTIQDGTLATSPSIADEATVTVIFTLCPTTSTLTNTTVNIGVKRQ